MLFILAAVWALTTAAARAGGGALFVVLLPRLGCLLPGIAEGVIVEEECSGGTWFIGAILLDDCEAK